MKELVNLFNGFANTKFGIGTGILAFIFGTGFLITNERDFKRTYDTINEAESVVVEAKDVNLLDAQLEGKLIYGVSKTQTDDTLTDELFEVAINAVKLVRNVEYYQWVEKESTETYEDSDGDTHSETTYTYNKEWSDKPVNSNQFNRPQSYTNTVLLEIEDRTVYADLVRWGAYKLPPFLKSKIDGDTSITVELSKEKKAEWENTLRQRYKQSENRDKREYLHVAKANSTVYLGINPDSPEIGDVRITIKHIPPGSDLSIIAQVQGNTFTEYTAKNGNTFFSIKNKIVPMKHMFIDEHISNTAYAWWYRLLGFLCVSFAFRCMFNLLTTLFLKIPVLGNILNVGIKMVCFVLGFVWSSVVIAVAYMFYRPITGAIILVVAVVAFLLLKRKGKTA